MLVRIMVSPKGKPGYFEAWEEGNPFEALCVSRQPFLDGARKLIAARYSPQADVVMRHYGRDEDVLGGKLGGVAKLTVAEGVNSGPSITAWKPSPYSAVTPPIEENEGAGTLPAGSP